MHSIPETLVDLKRCLMNGWEISSDDQGRTVALQRGEAIIHLPESLHQAAREMAAPKRRTRRSRKRRLNAPRVDGYYTTTRAALAIARDISSAAFAVYHALALCADRKTGYCYPSTKYIAKAAGCSVRTVNRLLPELEAAGWLKIFRSPGKETEYRVLGEPTPSVVNVATTCDTGVATTCDTGVATTCDIYDTSNAPKTAPNSSGGSDLRTVGECGTRIVEKESLNEKEEAAAEDVDEACETIRRTWNLAAEPGPWDDRTMRDCHALTAAQRAVVARHLGTTIDGHDWLTAALAVILTMDKRPPKGRREIDINLLFAKDAAKVRNEAAPAMAEVDGDPAARIARLEALQSQTEPQKPEARPMPPKAEPWLQPRPTKVAIPAAALFRQRLKAMKNTVQ